MNSDEYLIQLKKAFSQNGLADILDEDKARKLYAFSELLVESNKQFNLTAITDEKEIIVKHFLDCASVSPIIPHASTVIDVGCGAGFPAIPLAILREDLQITALDSTQKRITFVEQAADSIGINNVVAVCARAEDFASKHRESYDVCVSRAVARLNVLSELCIPLIKVGGAFVAMKSIKGDEEYAEAKSGITELGCSLKSLQTDKFEFDSLSLERKLFVFSKDGSTPDRFPRKYSQIVKKPL